ncbi:GNAT family N-acetyltransferase [Gordonia insulae]|uniref:N-acetyltransferase domain-containing protein n=1 Tax=Gordonia insulae TaxID=2420509 RepID=A0A3G8JIU5_9ACTN|nr:N-acetyltransferase [Gordonia insulae]AZG44923.1 hypothetical protein D7316_01515 [Gordonia insulae]
MNGNILPVECRTERADDIAAIRDVVTAAFGRSDEADLVDALRGEPDVWIPDLSVVATAAGGEIVGHALLTRCRVGDAPALALAPCSVDPGWQRRGVGIAAITCALGLARGRAAENLVVVLGHPEYYPRFGFRPTSEAGISASFVVPDGALMYLALDRSRPIPAGVITYPPAFGV